MIRRFIAVLHARNMEFLRDRSSLSWNLLVPVLLVAGMAWIFWEEDRPLFKVAVITGSQAIDASIHPFLNTQYVKFIPVRDKTAALQKVARHQIDMLVQFEAVPAYWVNPESPRGYILEKMLLGASGGHWTKGEAAGDPVRYIDWLLPGILGMNMMFSCLFGVGYVVVRYRKSGFLKRLSATPLRAVEFIAAQIVSRMVITLVSTGLVFWGTSQILDIRMDGSYWLLFLVAVAGAFSLIALALLVASRVTSEELASGVLNFLGWPMMLLSGVWFSIEGAGAILQGLAHLLPLTHILAAARAVMIDGAGFGEVGPHLAVLVGMGAVFMTAGALAFKWRVE